MTQINNRIYLNLLISALIAVGTNAFHARSQIEQGKIMCSDLVAQTELKVFRNPLYNVNDIKFITCRDYVNLYPLFPIRIWILHTTLCFLLILILKGYLK